MLQQEFWLFTTLYFYLIVPFPPSPFKHSVDPEDLLLISGLGFVERESIFPLPAKIRQAFFPQDSPKMLSFHMPISFYLKISVEHLLFALVVYFLETYCFVLQQKGSQSDC